MSTNGSDSTATKATVRQLIVTGLGHESPTFFLTNDRPQPQTAREVIQTYASRNHVENQLGEQITFFHLDCLCSDVRLNVDFDLTLTVLADLLYRSLAERLKGFARVGSGQAVPEVRRHAGHDRDHGERGCRPPEQAGPQSPLEGGRSDATDTSHTVAGRSLRSPDVPLTNTDQGSP